ncbi:MAG TPA: FtsX-like permease family protein [Acidothermaceae bacterium]
MTATLEERALKGQHGGAPARRAVVRWAWRLFRREWRRQTLVLLLLIVAVAATIVGLGAATNAALLKDDPTFGAANTIVSVPGDDPDIAGDVAALREQFGVIETISHKTVPLPGSVAGLDVRAQDPNGPYGHVMLRLDDGRYPNKADEVALTADAAKALELNVGDEWTGNGWRLRVVGLVENPLDLLDEFALVPPGHPISPDSYAIFLNGSGHGLDSLQLPSHAGVSISLRSTASQTDVAAVVLALSTFGLLFVGLMTVAGFAVMAHRRQRALGMLASLGATDRHLRLVVVANGAVVGVAAAVIGAVVGVAGWFAVAPAVQSVTKHRVDRLALPWWAVVTAMLLTVATAVAAAWWPARAVARTSPIAALSERPERPRPAHRFAVLGGALLSGGIALLAFANQHRAGFIIGGTVASAIGLLFFAPLGIRLLAAVAQRSTIAVRLALRDLVRYQSRSGAALGAITLAIGIAAAITIGAAANEEPAARANLPSNELVMHVSRGGPGIPVPPLTQAQLAAATTAVSRVAGSLHASALELDEAYNPKNATVPIGSIAESGGQSNGYMTPTLAKVTGHGHGENFSRMTTLYVATPQVLTHYGIATGQLRSDADVISSRTDLGGLQLFDPVTPGKDATPDQRTQRPNEVSTPVIQVMNKLPHHGSAPNALLTPHAMQAHGLATLPAGWLLETSEPLTSAQIDLATKAAAGAGLFVETRQPQKSVAALRNGATAAGMVLALGVLAMTVGLIRSETSRDVRTLTATGASSGTRRALTGVTAGALAFLGAVVGTGGAYGALLAWYHSDLTPLGRVPVVDLVLILVGLPVLAAAGGWLLAGREPAGIARQPLA